MGAAEIQADLDRNHRQASEADRQASAAAQRMQGDAGSWGSNSVTAFFSKGQELIDQAILPPVSLYENVTNAIGTAIHNTVNNVEDAMLDGLADRARERARENAQHGQPQAETPTASAHPGAPGSTGTTAQAAAAHNADRATTTASTDHVIKRGDSLWSIARDDYKHHHNNAVDNKAIAAEVRQLQSQVPNGNLQVGKHITLPS